MDFFWIFGRFWPPSAVLDPEPGPSVPPGNPPLSYAISMQLHSLALFPLPGLARERKERACILQALLKL